MTLRGCGDSSCEFVNALKTYKTANRHARGWPVRFGIAALLEHRGPAALFVRHTSYELSDSLSLDLTAV